MNLSRFPRRRYGAGPTPIQRMDRLSHALGGPRIYIKRDDLLGPGGGGNKTRKLEFLLAEALSQGADTILTAGAIQSNHCRLTLACANREGLKCQLLLHEPVPGSYDPEAGGNNFLYHLMGVEAVHLAAEGEDVMVRMQKIADDLAVQGRRPYIIPTGGSNVTGSLGYAACVQEMMGQLLEMGVALDAVVTTCGSAGTHAGLLTAMAGLSTGIPVVGISVTGPAEGLKERVYELSGELSDKLGIKAPPSMEDVIVLDGYLGPGYSLPSPEMVEAVKLTARTESILLDPVYTGKTMAGLIDLVRTGYFREGQNVLFLHTGGTAVLPVYQSAFREEAPHES